VVRRRAGKAATDRRSGSEEPEWLGARPERVTVDAEYRYDEAGELVESWDQIRGRTRYAYDPVGQLLAMVPEKARAELFRYDAPGNIYETGEGAEGREYGAGGRLLRKGATEYVWDFDGRLVEKRTTEGSWKYAWNAAGLLKQVDRPDGLRVELAYDPFARRVSKRVTEQGPTRFDRIAVSDTRFVWDGDVLVHEIEARARKDGDPVVEERTYWFEDDGFAPVAHRLSNASTSTSNPEWSHYVTDPIGTPKVLINTSGSVLSELAQSAWGATTQTSGAAPATRLRFQGQYEDEETRLCYNRHRYYEPTSGTFCSADPKGPSGTVNPFRYTPNPFTWIDPLGLAHMSRATLEIPNGAGGYDVHDLGTFPATSPDPTGHSERAVIKAAADKARAARPECEHPMEGTILKIHNEYDPCRVQRNGPSACENYLQRCAEKGKMRIEVTSDQNNDRKGGKGTLPTWVSDRRPGYPPVDPDPRWSK
jgi:RHS repeat-associated protein